MTKTIKSPISQKEKDGFTLIEVMLVLGITGLILVGLLGGTFSTIARQRYNDSLRGFTEYLSLAYNEALSPETLGQGNQDLVILGKVLVFGHDDNDKYDDTDKRSVFSATLVGNAEATNSSETDFIADLISKNTDAQLYCGQKDGVDTVEQYTPLWEAELKRAGTDANPFKDETFSGTLIIARTPSSGVIHTVFSDTTYDLKNKCKDGKDETGLAKSFETQRESSTNTIFKYENVGICVKASDSAILREVDIAADGRNSSAITTLSEEASKCKK